MKAQDVAAAAAQGERISELHLDHVEVKQLAFVLPVLTGLRRLAVIRCNLRQLPDSIGQCAKLDTLVLDRNRLQTLPEALSRCTRLFRLSAAHNRLAELPGGLANCLNLRQIELGHNHFIMWPQVLERLLWLARLDLSHNVLSCLPGFGGAYVQLRHLDLSGNALETLPEQAGFPRLETLLLRNNRLSNLPSAWMRLPVLEMLDISRNPIRALPELPAGLKRLDITGCPLAGLPPALLQLDHLCEIKGLKSEMRKKLLAFLGACRRRPLPRILRQVLFAAFCGETAALDALGPAECLQALALPLPVLRERIVRRLTQPQLPPKGALLAGIGRLSTPVAVWRNRTEAAGLMLVPPEHAGWIVLGRPPYRIPATLSSDVVFIREQTLLEVMDDGKTAGTTWTEQQLQQLRRLLTQAGAGNAALALRIMQGSGLPGDLHTELLYAWMQAPAGKLKTGLRDLLECHTPQESRYVLGLPLKARITKFPERAEAILRQALENTIFDVGRLIFLLNSQR